jgi:hypothetical protein
VDTLSLSDPADVEAPEQEALHVPAALSFPGQEALRFPAAARFPSQDALSFPAQQSCGIIPPAMPSWCVPAVFAMPGHFSRDDTAAADVADMMDAFAAEPDAIFSSFIPHLGHVPGLSETTSWSMGQR